MSISNTDRVAGPYAGNGVAVAFPFGFKVFQTSEVLVAFLNAAGAEVVQVLNSDYTVTLNADQDVEPGGVVTFAVAPEAGASVTLTSQVEALQPVRLTNLGGFFPEVINTALDRLTILVQQTQGLFSRTLQLPASETGANLTIPPVATRADKLFAFDSLGNPAAVLPVADSASGVRIDLASTDSGKGAELVALSGSETVAQRFAQVFNASKYGFHHSNTAEQNTTALQSISAAVNAAGGGKVVFPAGVHTVGAQDLSGAFGQGVAWRRRDMLRIENCTKPVIIECYGTVFKMADGLRFGSFHPVTGAPYTPPGMPFLDQDYGADPGMVFQFYNNSAGVVVKGSVEIDGNNTRLVIGGLWGDLGYQRMAYGVWEYNNASFYIENAYLHHHGTDGIVCGYTGAVATGAKTPKTLINVNSEYNGRQGLSWVGGKGLTAIGCKFNRTGRAVNIGTGLPLASAPGAGVDIEAESSVCRDGDFINCEMVNNVQVAMVADSGDSANVRWTNCDFAGVTWAKKPGFKFDGCRFYGQMVNVFGSDDPTAATAYTDCVFYDTQFDDWLMPAPLGELYFITPNTKPFYMERCVIHSTRVRPGRLDYAVMRNCRVNLSLGTVSVANQDFVANILGAVLENTTWDANITTNPPADGFYINYAGLCRTIGRNILTNTAGVVRWDTWNQAGGGFIGELGSVGAQTGGRIGQVALSLFPNAYLNQYYGTLDVYAGTAPPTTGTYKRGDRYINQLPAVGQPKGWVCTVAGTPGTWVSEGNL